MNIKELRLQMMKSKKDDVEKSKVLQAILSTAQIMAKDDGNREADEKDIVNAAKREAKLAQQSKELGAPYNELTFEVCQELIPAMLSEEKTIEIVKGIVSELAEPSKKQMGVVMGIISKEYGDTIDKKIVAGALKELLN